MYIGLGSGLRLGFRVRVMVSDNSYDLGFRVRVRLKVRTHD